MPWLEKPELKSIFASCAPPIRFNHIYGIDLADTKALVGFNRDENEIAQVIGADKVIYQDLQDLIDCCKSDIIKILKLEYLLVNILLELKIIIYKNWKN